MNIVKFNVRTISVDADLIFVHFVCDVMKLYFTN